MPDACQRENPAPGVIAVSVISKDAGLKTNPKEDDGGMKDENHLAV
jgi:hypothetical protein